ncbi:hypothetical protein AAFF_G00212910, partial [Aldrovandia affinis]
MYMMEVSDDVKDVNLDVSLKVAGRTNSIKWTFINSNAYITRTEKTQIDKNLVVTAKGTSKGTLSVVTIYNALPDGNKTDCKNFELEVKLEKEKRVTYDNAEETYKLTIEM